MPDYEYIYDGLTKHTLRWERDAWRTREGPIAHVDLWTHLIAYISWCTVRSVRAVNVEHATLKMQTTKHDDSIMSKVHQYRGLEPKKSNW